MQQLLQNLTQTFSFIEWNLKVKEIPNKINGFNSLDGTLDIRIIGKSKTKDFITLEIYKSFGVFSINYQIQDWYWESRFDYNSNDLESEKEVVDELDDIFSRLNSWSNLILEDLK